MAVYEIESDMQRHEVKPKYKYIDRLFAKNPLLGNAIINEENIEKINQYARKRLICTYDGGEECSAEDALYITLAAVNFAKNWDSSDESKFTKYVTMQFGLRDIQGKVWRAIASSIEKACRFRNRLFIKDDTGRAFYESVIVHSFGPQGAWFSTFDFLFDFYIENMHSVYVENDPIILHMVYEVQKLFCTHENNDNDTLQISTKKYMIRLGARRLIQLRPMYTAQLFNRILGRIDASIKNQPKSVTKYIDTLVDIWFVKRMTENVIRREINAWGNVRTHEMAFDYKKIRIQYCIVNDNVGFMIPTIRLQSDKDGLAKAIIYSGNENTEEYDLSTYGNELGRSISHQIIEYRDVATNERICPRLKILYCDEVIFDSQRMLWRSAIAFKNGYENSLNSLRTGETYDFYFVNTDVVEMKNVSKLNIENHFIKSTLGNKFSISINGSIVSMDMTDIRDIRILEPAIAKDLVFFCEGIEYPIVSDKDILEIYMGNNKKPSDYYLVINGLKYSMDRFFEPMDGLIRYKLCFNELEKADSIIDISLYGNNMSQQLMARKIYYIASELIYKFDKAVYITNEDYINAYLDITYQGKRTTIRFLQNELQIRYPILNGEFLFSIPKIAYKLENIDGQIKNHYIWFDQINEESEMAIVNQSHLGYSLLINGNVCTELIDKFSLQKILNENREKNEICFTLSCNGIEEELFTILIYEKFIQEPIFKYDSPVLSWDGGISFIGKSDSVLSLDLYMSGVRKYRFPLCIGKAVISEKTEITENTYDYKIVNRDLTDENIIYSGSQLFGHQCAIRFIGRVILISYVTEDAENNISGFSIKTVYIDNIKYKTTEEVPSEGGTFDIYEGRMFYKTNDGRIKTFSDKYHTYNGKSVYQINPVKIIYINQSYLRIVNSDDEGLYCFYNEESKMPGYEITDIEPLRKDKSYKDILFYQYITIPINKSEHKINIVKDTPEFNLEDKNEIKISLLEKESVKKEEMTNDLFKKEREWNERKYVEVLQEDVITADVKERLLINAGPGTGKTWTLIEKLIYEVDDLGIQPDNIIVLCFSRAAVEVIRARLDDAVFSGRTSQDIQLVDIRTFDSFASQVLYWAKDNETYGSYLTELKDIGLLDYEERIQAYTELIKREPDILAQCSHMVVDEVQDLVNARAKMVLAMIDVIPKEAGVTLLGDFCQAIYDYQAISDDESFSSEEFYKSVKKRRRNFTLYTFAKNHRQTDQLAIIGNELRNGILEGSEEKCKNEVAKIEKEIPYFGKQEFHIPTSKEISELVKNGTVGILTRRNGQALMISSELREYGIKHVVKQRLSDNNLSEWIAICFNNYSNKTMNYDDFMQNIHIYAPTLTDDSKLLWQALTEKMTQKTRYEIRDILLSILHYAKSSLLYTQEKQSDIVVSNIHRSKGKEFDTVFISNDLFKCNDLKLQKSTEEYRVTYVSITRAKTRLFQMQLSAKFMYKMDDNRCFEKNFTYNYPLRNFEIGMPYDVDNYSFVDMDKVQAIIQERRDNLRNQKVELILDDTSYTYPIYNIILSQEKIVLGRMSEKFTMSIKEATHKALKSISRTAPENANLPYKLSNVYVDDIISVVAPYKNEYFGINDYEDVCVWNSITLLGYAKVDYLNGER